MHLYVCVSIWKREWEREKECVGLRIIERERDCMELDLHISLSLVELMATNKSVSRSLRRRFISLQHWLQREEQEKYYLICFDMCFKTDFVFVWTTISDNVNVGSTHTKLLERLFTKKIHLK